MPWHSLSEILVEFEISKDTNDLAGIRQELRERLGELHPDRTNGKFRSEEQKQRFIYVQEALDFVDRTGTPTALPVLPADQLPAIIEAVGKAISERFTLPLQQQETQTLADACKALKRHYAFPKLTSGLFITIAVFLLSLQGKFKDQPLYRTLSHSVALTYFRQQVSHDPPGCNFLYQHIEGLSPQSPKTANIAKLQEKLSKPLNTLVKSVTVLCPHTFWFDFIPERALNPPDPSYDFASYDFAKALFDDPEVLKESSGQASQVKDELEKMLNASPFHKSRYAAMSEVGAMRDSVREIKGLLERIGREVEKSKTETLAAADRAISLLLLLIFTLASTGLLLSWLRHRSDEWWIEHLLTEEGVVETLAKVGANGRLTEQGSIRFSAAELRRAMSKKTVDIISSVFLGRHVDPCHLEHVGNTVIHKLLHRKAITRTESGDAQLWYEIPTDIVQRYVPGRCTKMDAASS